jgi:O-antigen/teichoic acid export membrane protein
VSEPVRSYAPVTAHDGSGRGFLSALARVGGVSAAAQLVVVALAPVLARLYEHDDFGVFGVFLSCATILAAIAPLGYPEGLLAPPGRRQSDGLFSASLWASLVGGLFCGGAAAAILWSSSWADAILPWWAGLLLAPAIVGMAATYSIQIFIAREADWRAAQELTIVQAALRVVLQLSFAFAGLGAAGLACAEAAMRVLTAAFGLWRIRVKLNDRIRPIGLTEVTALARRYWQFPAVRMPSSLINNVATLMPAPLIALLFGLGPAGLWTLVDQVLNVPLGFVNKTVGDVFAGTFTRAFHQDRAAARRLFWLAAAVLTPVGLVPAVILDWFGPGLFALVFGADWRMAGELAGMLCWALWARFVALPLSWACNTVNRPEAKLVFDLLQIALVALVFGYARMTELAFEATVALLTAAYLIANLALLALAAWAIHHPREQALV